MADELIWGRGEEISTWVGADTWTLGPARTISTSQQQLASGAPAGELIDNAAVPVSFNDCSKQKNINNCFITSSYSGSSWQLAPGHRPVDLSARLCFSKGQAN